MKRPDILYVAACWPHGRPFGSQLRVLHLARALQQCGRLRLAVVDVVPDETEGIDRTKAEFDVVGHTRPIDAGKPGWQERFHRTLNPRVVNPYGTALEAGFRTRIMQLADQASVVWFSYLRPMSAFNRWAWPHSVMDIDDVPSTYARTIARHAPQLGTRVRAWWQMLAWQRRERRLSERFTVLGVSSEPDKAYLRSPGPVHVLPNGFEKPALPPLRCPSSPPRLGFIGKFDYPPNSDGVRWFAQECWPIIKREHPGARLRLVGSGSDGALKPEGPDIDGLGRIEDPRDEIATWNAMVVPVRIGAGTRVKVLEAFSRKCPVVGTSIGVFGHPVKHGEDLFIGDSPTEFAEGCLRVIRDPAAAAAMAERAWDHFLKEWTWDATATRVEAAVADCLKRSAPGAVE